MIIPKLKGGLCNQMFQIATAYGVAKRSYLEYGIDPSLEWTGGQEGCAHIKYLDNIFKDIPRGTYDETYTTYEEPTFSHKAITGRPNLLIDGYFQCERYFSEYRNDLQSLFHFDDDTVRNVNEKLDKIKNTFNVDTVVSIHVRRGEYLVPGYNHVHVARTRNH